MAEPEPENTETTAFEQLNTLLESIEQHPDPAVRDHVRALVYTLLDLHHAALRRIVEITSADAEITRELNSDELVQAVLMVHDLMGRPLMERIEAALEDARSKLEEHGADVELVGVTNGVARLKLFGSASTANISTKILKSEIERSLHRHTPDLLNVEYEDLIASMRPANLVQIKPLKEAEESESPLVPVIQMSGVPVNEIRAVETGEAQILLCNVAGTIYAFRNECAHRNMPLEEALLEGGVLTCPWHGYQFDVRQGGRCLTDPALKLDALRVKVENEVVKVVLPKEA